MFRFTGKVALSAVSSVDWPNAASIVVYAKSKKEATEKALAMLGTPPRHKDWVWSWKVIEEERES